MTFRPRVHIDGKSPTGGSPPYTALSAGGSESESVLELVVTWHDQNHSDPWAFCGHELCDAVRGRTSGSVEDRV